MRFGGHAERGEALGDDVAEAGPGTGVTGLPDGRACASCAWYAPRAPARSGGPARWARPRRRRSPPGSLRHGSGPGSPWFARALHFDLVLSKPENCPRATIRSRSSIGSEKRPPRPGTASTNSRCPRSPRRCAVPASASLLRQPARPASVMPREGVARTSPGDESVCRRPSWPVPGRHVPQITAHHPRPGGRVAGTRIVRGRRTRARGGGHAGHGRPLSARGPAGRCGGSTFVPAQEIFISSLPVGILGFMSSLLGTEVHSADLADAVSRLRRAMRRAARAADPGSGAVRGPAGDAVLHGGEPGDHARASWPGCSGWRPVRWPPCRTRCARPGW